MGDFDLTRIPGLCFDCGEPTSDETSKCGACIAEDERQRNEVACSCEMEDLGSYCWCGSHRKVA